jgi:hypothetical protein
MAPYFRIARIVRLFTLLGLLQPLLAHSRTVVKSDSLILTTDNQKYDFVMRPSSDHLTGCATSPPMAARSGGPKDERVPPSEHTMGRLIINRSAWDSFCDRSVRASQYPVSGLYDHGSKVPIWTVDWHEVSVVVAEDGHHLSRLAWDYGSDLNHPAIIFYEDGKEIRSWSMRELVDNNPLCLLKEGWHFGLDLENHSGDEIRISTRGGQTVIFSLLTGEMIERTISQCPLEFPRIPELGLWSTTIQDPQASIELDEDHKTNYGVLLSIALGIVIILLQTRKAHKERNRSDD